MVVLGALTSALRGLIPVVIKILPNVVAQLATGGLSGLSSTGTSKSFGSGMITLAASRKTKGIKSL